MVYIATHKKFIVPLESGYKPIQVGASGEKNLGYLLDNTGENISEKNKNYCELTGAYWVWKNVNDDYKGLVHYRRYFSNSFRKKFILKEKEIASVLQNYDVILPFRVSMKESLIDDFCKISGYKKDLETVRQIIGQKYPAYLNSYDEIMNGNKIYFYNMLIAKRNVFDNYCEWLFSILFELEKKVDLTKYNDYQKRIYGFISERLLNVYFVHNGYRIFECGVINTEENWCLWKNIRTALKRKILYQVQLCGHRK